MIKKIAVLAGLIFFGLSVSIADESKCVVHNYNLFLKGEQDLTSLDYPFNKFKKIINQLVFENYQKNMCIEVNDQYMATFIKDAQNTIVVTAFSKQDFDASVSGFESDDYESFDANGKKMYYGKMKDESTGEKRGNVLFVEFPEHGMIVSIISPRGMTKEKLLQIVNQMPF